MGHTSYMYSTCMHMYETGEARLPLLETKGLMFVCLFVCFCIMYQPCHLRDWEMFLQFKVHGSGSSLFGDGFALWYTRERMEPGEYLRFSGPITVQCILLPFHCQR